MTLPLSPLAGTDDFGCLDLDCPVKTDTYPEMDAHLVIAHDYDPDPLIPRDTHPFEAFDGASGLACTAMVLRDGHGADCGLPAAHPDHRGAA